VAGDRLQDLIAYIASSLVDDPDAVEVNVVEEDRAIVLELTVAPDDLGKVIGKEGRTAKAIRTLLGSAAAKAGANTDLTIVDENE
jgi:predicted RNA-binding protein YlqC (UPF0109 family)